MEKIFTNRWSIVVILGAIVLTAFLIFQNAQPVKASVDFESAGYKSTVTATGKTNSGLLKLGSGTFGSVVITGAAAGTFILYDASTTNSSLRTITATSSLVQLASFPTNTATGTYTFDITFNQGLIVDFTSTQGTTTITWK